MKLVVISPETDHPQERELVQQMFAHGLDRYHLRKPNWSVGATRDWLTALTPEQRRRTFLHQHHPLASAFLVGGIHGPHATANTSMAASRSCHSLSELREAVGSVSSAFLSPIFPSYSKTGYQAESPWPWSELSRTLRSLRSRDPRGEVIALGGIDSARVRFCAQLGFHGVAVLGAIWNSAEPLKAFERLRDACASAGRIARFAPTLPITQDGLALSHVQQAEELCAAGARWIQLRVKDADYSTWLQIARETVRVCRSAGVACVINDNVEIALAAEADGVHLGKSDMDWMAARRKLGSSFIIGGTVNNLDDASRAVAAGCLDYVGVGPWRFTSNKKNLSPILGAAGVAEIISRIAPLPAWVIGGIEVQDAAAVYQTGAAGVAVSSALYRSGAVRGQFGKFQQAWFSAAESALTCPRRRGHVHESRSVHVHSAGV